MRECRSRSAETGIAPAESRPARSPATTSPASEDASYVKFRELSLSYTFEGPFVNRLFGFSSIDLRVPAETWKTWSKYRSRP